MKRIIILLFGSVFALAVFLSADTLKEPVSKEDLGKLLFFDPILSKDRTISCGSCHRPDFAFADTSAFSRGVGGKAGLRNSPSVMNVRLRRFFFWDGRAASLEEQALGPIENPIEMNLPIEQALNRLRKSKTYSQYFLKIFGNEPNRENLAQAIAAFERKLETSDSPFDKWKFSDDSSQVTPAVKRGFDLFNGKAKCSRCHFGADFTLNEFRNIGLFDGAALNDSGRMTITKLPADLGRFKIPVLRNISLTAPYMHNGMFRTLEEVIDFYNDPAKKVPNGINRDTILAKPLGLANKEKADLVAFLHSLTDESLSKKRPLSNQQKKQTKH